MTYMGRYRRFSNCYYLAFVADLDFCLSIATFVWCREGHSYGSHHRNCHHHHYAKNRDVAAHTNHTSLCRWGCAIALDSTVRRKSLLPVPVEVAGLSSPPFSLLANAKTGLPLICEIAGCATGSLHPFKRPSLGKRSSKLQSRVGRFSL